MRTKFPTLKVVMCVGGLTVAAVTSYHLLAGPPRQHPEPEPFAYDPDAPVVGTVKGWASYTTVLKTPGAGVATTYALDRTPATPKMSEYHGGPPVIKMEHGIVGGHSDASFSYYIGHEAIDDLPLVETRSGPVDNYPEKDQDTREAIGERIRKRYPKWHEGQLFEGKELDQPGMWLARTASGAASQYLAANGRFRGRAPDTDGVYYDSLPRSANTEWVFLLLRNQDWQRRSKIQVYQGVGKWLKDFDQWLVEWDEHPRYWIDANFCEPFVAYVRGENAYFITSGGDLYATAGLKRPDTGANITTRHPLGRGQKIGAIIQDANTGRVFVFGKPALWRDSEQLNFYCELTETGPLTLKWFDQGAVKPVEYPAVPKRLAAVDQLARVLRAEKVLPE